MKSDPSLPLELPGPTLRVQRLLRAVVKDPSRARDDRRCHKPAFCLSYLDSCDDRALTCDRQALEQPDLVLDPARVAHEIALKTDDRHLIHRSLGVLAHAHLAVEQPEAARDVLESFRLEAQRCCSSCHGHWLRRHGDYLVEVRDGETAHGVLNGSLSKAASPDGGARTFFVRGISRHYLGDRDRALEDEVRVLESLELTSPRGYFIDAMAILTVLLRGAAPRHDEEVLLRLGGFKARLKGIKYRTDMRTRLSWVEGVVHARLGDFRRAVDRLESARLQLLAGGPLRHAVAVTLDLCQIYLRRRWYHQAGYQAAQRILATCKTRLDEAAAAGQEDREMIWRLKTLDGIIDDRPDKALEALVALRASFVVPVPGIVAERLRV